MESKAKFQWKYVEKVGKYTHKKKKEKQITGMETFQVPYENSKEQRTRRKIMVQEYCSEWRIKS